MAQRELEYQGDWTGETPRRVGVFRPAERVIRLSAYPSENEVGVARRRAKKTDGRKTVPPIHHPIDPVQQKRIKRILGYD